MRDPKERLRDILEASAAIERSRVDRCGCASTSPGERAMSVLQVHDLILPAAGLGPENPLPPLDS